jgi:hypothetical protein
MLIDSSSPSIHPLCVSRTLDSGQCVDVLFQSQGEVWKSVGRMDVTRSRIDFKPASSGHVCSRDLPSSQYRPL